MMRLRWVLFIVMALVLPGFGGSAPASADPAEATPAQAAPVLGLNSHGLEEEWRAALRRANVRHVRWTLYWDLWEKDAAYREWNTAQLRAALSELSVLVIVHGSDPHPGRGEPMQRYAAFLGRLAARFPRAQWQVWNEVDGDHHTSLFRAPTLRERGRLYGRQLRLVREAAPSAFLVAAGIAPESAPGFWAGMRETGPEPDALAVHVYGPPLGERVRSVAARVRAGAAGTPVWATEFGVEARADHGISEEEQRDNWQGFYRAAAGVFERAYGYGLTTDEAGRYGTVEKHGILRPDGTPRPAYEWLRRTLGAAQR